MNTPLLTGAEPHPTGGWRWVLEWVDPDGQAHRLTGTHPYRAFDRAHRIAIRQAAALPTYDDIEDLTTP